MALLLEAPLLLIDERAPRHCSVQSRGGLFAAYSGPYPHQSGPNQDAAAVIPLDGATVAAVADGMGGAPQGHEASRIAIETLNRELSRADSGQPDARAAILDTFESAHGAIRELATGAATTLAVVEIRERTLRPYHAGDSSILVCGSRGKLKFVSLSHSPVGYGVEAGLIDAEEALFHEERNVVSNTLGTAGMHIELGAPIELAARDTVVLGTDGLFDNLHLEEIVEVVRSGDLEAAANELAQRATQRMLEDGGKQPSKPDDLTFVLYRPLLGS